MKVNDKDAYWGELFLRVINDIDRPMLMFKGEKEAVKHALELMLQVWEKQKTGSEENNWIPWNERPPKKEGDYLVTVDENGKRYVSEDFFYFRGDGTPSWYLPDNVVAWMPLPQPYRNNKNPLDEIKPKEIPTMMRDYKYYKKYKYHKREDK